MDIRVGHYPEMSELRVELFGHEPLIGQSHDGPTCVTQHALAGHHDDDDEEEKEEDYDKTKDSY